MRTSIVVILALWLAACAVAPPQAPPQPIEPVAITPPQDIATAPVVRRELPEPVAIAPPATPPTVERTVPPAAKLEPAPIVVPTGAIYLCVQEAGSERKQTVIEFAPRVGDLCRKHPEMGPCQYERDMCRRSGGRVYASSGQEITLATEAEYDRKVIRVRFRAN